MVLNSEALLRVPPRVVALTSAVPKAAVRTHAGLRDADPKAVDLKDADLKDAAPKHADPKDADPKDVDLRDGDLRDGARLRAPRRWFDAGWSSTPTKMANSLPKN
ncbi:MAG: hypothetical protein ACKOGA_07945 [Planctomycetaceae bacterium]